MLRQYACAMTIQRSMIFLSSSASSIFLDIVVWWPKFVLMYISRFALEHSARSSRMNTFCRSVTDDWIGQSRHVPRPRTRPISHFSKYLNAVGGRFPGKVDGYVFNIQISRAGEIPNCCHFLGTVCLILATFSRGDRFRRRFRPKSANTGGAINSHF